MTGLAGQLVAELDRLVPPGVPVLVAVSGGADSLALLGLLHTGGAHDRRRLAVGHVDHGIHRESATVARAVAAEAARLGLPCHTASCALGPGTTETAARRARRAALADLAEAAGAGAVVLAHHADDQVETILMRVLRGSGIVGLAGMAPRHGRFVRPALAIPGETLRAARPPGGMPPWSDPANADPSHLRSWLRTALLPALRARLPDVDRTLGALGGHAARHRAVLDDLPELLPGLAPRAEGGGWSVAAPPVRGYRSEVRHAVLEALARRVGVTLGVRRVAAIERLLDGGRTGKVIQVDPRLCVELAGGRLLFHPPAVPPSAAPLPARGVARFGEWELAVTPEAAGPPEREGRVAWFTPGPLAVRAWRPGDRIRPLGGMGHRAVGVLLREAGVPRGHRAAWPVIVEADRPDATILWVPGICRSEERLPDPGHPREAQRVECHLR